MANFNRKALVRIVPKPGEYAEKLVRRFKRLCEKEGLVKDFKRHEYFESPSQKRRRKKMLAIKRQNKEQSQPKPTTEFNSPLEEGLYTSARRN